MTNFTMIIAAGTLMPGLLIAGGFAALLPIAVLLIIRRRSQLMDWGAMRLVQETLSKRAPVRILRLLLLLARSMLGPCAAASVAGVWLSGSGAIDTHPPIIVLDDTIVSWVPGSDGRRDMDDHLDLIDEYRIRFGSSHPLQIVLLSGRIPDGTDRESLARLDPVSSGPDWWGAQERVRRLVEDHTEAPVLFVSAMRKGTVQSFHPSDDPITFRYTSPASHPRESVRITSAKAPRSVLLPGDPLLTGQLTVELSRSDATSSKTSRLRVDVLDVDGAVMVEGRPFDVQWPSGDLERSVSVDVPAQITGDSLLHISLEGIESPAAHWWVALNQRPFVEVTLVTEEKVEEFDPNRQASWLKAAIEAASDESEVMIRSVDPAHIEVDTLPTDLPVFITSPGAVAPATWTALLERRSPTEIIVFPPIDADGGWLRTLLEGSGIHDIDALPVVHVPTGIRQVEFGRDAGPLEMLRSELPGLLELVQIERMIDLQRVIESNLARPLLSIDGRPLLVELETPFEYGTVIVSALSWHPSWSDLPVRSASPAMIQELLRSGAESSLDGMETAHGPTSLTAGPRAGGTLILPDVDASDTTPIDSPTIQRLHEAQWRPSTDGASPTAERVWAVLFAATVLGLLLVETWLVRCIDHRSGHRKRTGVAS